MAKDGLVERKVRWCGEENEWEREREEGGNRNDAVWFVFFSTIPPTDMVFYPMANS